MATCFNQQINLGIMGEDEEDDLDSSSSSSFSNGSSNSSDFMEDATSSSSSSSDHITTTTTTTCGGPLYEMSSLMQQLPFKRGLSKHFQGKSQSFTSLSNVRSLEDLAKPDHPYKKKLKSCKSYAGGISETNNNNNNKASSHPKACSKISKKGSARGSWASLSTAKKSNSFLGNRPPVHPQRTSSLFNQTPLFA